MRIHGNTLYVQTAGAYLRKDGETVKVEVEREARLTVPLHHLEGIVCFGRVSISPPLMGECCERDIGISWMTDAGRFLCRVVGAESGNVLLRRQQYRLADLEATTLPIARAVVAAKIQNSRTVATRGMEEGYVKRERLPAGTLGDLCQGVTALVCFTHHDRARRGTIRRMLRSVPSSSSAPEGGSGAVFHATPRSHFGSCPGTPPFR